MRDTFFYRRCLVCRRPVEKSRVLQYRHLVEDYGPMINPRTDVIRDEYPRPGMPPMGFYGWCEGH